MEDPEIDINDKYRLFRIEKLLVRQNEILEGILESCEREPIPESNVFERILRQLKKMKVY